MPDKEITCDLFRFLQLLCEGHNSGYFPTLIILMRIKSQRHKTGRSPSFPQSFFKMKWTQALFWSVVACCKSFTSVHCLNMIKLFACLTEHVSIFVCKLGFQNYLRTQTGNNTTVNIVISTVDYLLRIQVNPQWQVGKPLSFIILRYMFETGLYMPIWITAEQNMTGHQGLRLWYSVWISFSWLLFVLRISCSSPNTCDSDT